MGIAAQRGAQLARRLGENRPGLARKGDQRAGLHPLQTGDRADVESLMFGDQIDHLAADHASGAGRSGKAATSSQRTAGSPCVSGWASTSKAAVNSPSPASTAVASSNSLWQVGAAAAQIAVVHRRQIVVDERIGMHHLDRRRDLQRAASRHPEKLSAGQHQERAQPLARRQRRIAHRVINPRLEVRGTTSKPLERGVGQLRRLPSAPRKRDRIGPQRLSQVSPAPR